MKRVIGLLTITILLSAVPTMAQRKRSMRAPARNTAAAKAAEVQRTGAVRVAEQIKNLTRFIYLLGGVAKSIETVDEAVRRNQATPTIVEQTRKSKLSVRQSIQSVREGLDKLEIDFRATPELQRYYIKLAGVAAGAASAEEQAAANQFDRAGRTLLEVVNRLTDVLLEMRG